MFVFSLKATNIKKILLVLLALILIFGGAYFLLLGEDKSNVTSKMGVCTRAETEEERIAYISQFGYEVNKEPKKVEEVIIPEEFDEIYSSYNEIQKQQGFDLERYKGCRVKKWTYEVTNLKDYEEGTVEINLLVYDSVVIASDIQCLKQDGFLKALNDAS